MKTLSTIIALFVFVFVSTAQAIDISATTILERYTITNNEVELANGYLLKNGQFQVINSFILDPLFYDSINDFWPINGRPVMMESLFDGYQSAGVIPNWVRSRDTFSYGYVDFVIVAVKGGDPNPIPTIIEQPENKRVLEGDSVWLTVDAEPWLYLSYQWYFKNKPIPGETGAWLVFADARKADAGLYSVAVSAGGKPLMSRKAMLTVIQPVSVKTQPKSQTISAGKKAVLRVTAAGTPPFTYQWYWNANVITNATKSTLTTTNEGQYVVVVRNDLSAIQSTNAVVTITGH